MDELDIAEQGGRLMVRLKVIPKASRSEVSGVEAGALVVRVKAPPVDGKANAAVVDLVARSLGLRKSQVEIVSGEKARHKRMALDGTNPQALLRLARGKETN